MVKRNTFFSEIKPTYLFSEISKRAQHFLEKNPDAKLISLGIGDTTEPIPSVITDAMAKAAKELSSRAGYRGYGPEQGDIQLREQISSIFYSNQVDPDEIFISDGAKTDLGRLQVLFGNSATIAVQDPVYPAYVDSGILSGKKVVYLSCIPENDFFPSKFPHADIYFICSPNNPTGAAITQEQLIKLVSFVRDHQALILFDAAYSAYIQDQEIPRSIYKVPGAKEFSIEVSSFSKLIGFTGVRLGWTVVPKSLKYQDGYSIYQDWKRLYSTFFNGASLISQIGGLAVLSKEGLDCMKEQISFYCENVKILHDVFKESKTEVYGGMHSPYLWVRMAKKNSWEVFYELLEKTHLITTPGSGFGPSGEGFLRISAFGTREKILEAAGRLKKWQLSM